MNGTRGTALVMIWSAGFIGAELGARYSGADTVLAWRCLVTAVVLSPWLVPAVRQFDRRDWLRQGVLAVLCQFLYLEGVFRAAAAGVPAGTSALVASLQPALVLVVCHRLRVRHLLGLALGTAGVALTAAGDLRSGVTGTALLLPLTAMLAITGGTLLQQRWPTPPLPQTLAVQGTFTAVLVAGLTVVTGDLTPPAAPGFWGAVAWAVTAGIGSYGTYYLVADRDGAGAASLLLYLTPAVTALWAVLMFGRPLRVTTLLGLLVGASAVFLLRTAAGPTTPGRRSPLRSAAWLSTAIRKPT